MIFLSYVLSTLFYIIIHAYKLFHALGDFILTGLLGKLNQFSVNFVVIASVKFSDPAPGNLFPSKHFAVINLLRRFTE
jgi:hypothetical protein